MAEAFRTPQEISYKLEFDDVKVYYLTDHPYAHRWFYPRYANNKLHEPVLTRLIWQRLTPNSTFLDVGAHLGYFACLAAMKCKTVFCFEMRRELIPLIANNVAANHLDNVHIINAAVGQRSGFVPYARFQGGFDPSRQVPLEEGESSEWINVLSLDDVMSDSFAPTHIKIDVEGYEYLVIRGSESVLRQYRPVIFMEIHDSCAKFGGSVQEIVDFMSKLGYGAYLVDHRSTGRRVELQAVSRNFPKNGLLVFQVG